MNYDSQRINNCQIIVSCMFFIYTSCNRLHIKCDFGFAIHILVAFGTCNDSFCIHTYVSFGCIQFFHTLFTVHGIPFGIDLQYPVEFQTNQSSLLIRSIVSAIKLKSDTVKSDKKCKMDKFTRNRAYLKVGDRRYVYERAGEEDVDNDEVIWPIAGEFCLSTRE